MEHAGKILDTIEWEGQSISIIDCGGCGFIHADPYPTQDELTRIYSSEYFEKVKPEFKGDDDRDAAWIARIMDDRLEVIDELIEFHAPRRILDVGAGFGTFLDRAEFRGWQTFGAEPSRQACEYSRLRGHVMTEAMFPTGELAGQLFNAIHMREVLNHAANPLEILQSAYELLKPGGVLCGSVAYDYSPLQAAAREHLDCRPWWLAYPYHLNFFQPYRLWGLLDKAGFTGEREWHGSYPIEMALLSGRNYLTDKELGKAIHQERVQFDLNTPWALRRKWYDYSLCEGISREIVFYATK